MITSINIMEYLEGKLNSISGDLGYDILFDGDVSFYDYEWYERKFGSKATPFVLATNAFETMNAGVTGVTFRYTLITLGFDEDREKIEFIYDRLYNDLRQETISGINVNFRPTNKEYGESVSIGSGDGLKRFEAIFEFQGTATNSYSPKSTKVKFGTEDIIINSWRVRHSKVDYANVNTEYTNNALNKDLNVNELVLECIMGDDNLLVNELIETKQNTNITRQLTITNEALELVNGKYKYEGYTIGSAVSDDNISAFLYFSLAKKDITITINQITVPVLNYAMSAGVDKLPHTSPNDNVTKQIYLGNVLSLAFDIADDIGNEIVEMLEEDLMEGGRTRIPIYQVYIKLNSKGYQKTLLLDDISKDRSGSFYTVKFLESSDLNG